MDRLLRVQGVADMIAMGKSTVWNLVADGKLPKPKKIGNASVWKQSEIQEFINSL